MERFAIREFRKEPSPLAKDLSVASRPSSDRGPRWFKDLDMWYVSMAMKTTWEFWRAAIAILLIAAFVMPAPRHIHAAHGDSATQVVATHDHSGCADRNVPSSDSAQDERQSQSHGACCSACTGHVVPALQATSTFTRHPLNLRLTVLRTDVLYPGIIPESLPEPPRSFA